MLEKKFISGYIIFDLPSLKRENELFSVRKKIFILHSH